MKFFKTIVCCLLVVALIAGCSNASSYVKDNYPLVNVQGKGKDSAKIYSAEGKDVPTVANELADKEKPKEHSKESSDQMFLVYQDKIINIQKDPENAKNSLIEIDTIEYAKDHYDSSFLQGYLTATLLQSLFGGGWFNNRNSHTDYKGYTTSKSYTDNRPNTSNIDKKPTTSDRTGFFGTGKSSGSGSVKNDGSTPKLGKPSGLSKPGTSSRSGSFSKRK